jgi:hypothetical protein
MSDNFDEIERFIRNEKEISQAKINLLNRTGGKQEFKSGLIEDELRFIGFSFSSLDFHHIDEARGATSLFRSSAKEFCELYSISYDSLFLPKGKDDSSEVPYKLMVLAKKVDFLRNLSFYYKILKPQQINPVQDPDVFSIYASYMSKKCGMDEKECRAITSSKTLSSLLDEEPIIVSRARARLQVLSYSVSLYIDSMIEPLMSNFLFRRVYNYSGGYHDLCSILSDLELDNADYGDISEYYSLLIRKVDAVVSGMGDCFFKFFNKSSDDIGNFAGTMGENHSIGKVCKLYDLFGISRRDNFLIKIDSLFETNSLSMMKIPTPGKPKYGVVLPILRNGNEKVDIFYKSIICDGIDVSSMFRDRCSNILATLNDGSVQYLKAVVVKKDRIPEAKFILESRSGIPMDDRSLCLVSKTRSENNFLLSSFSILERGYKDLKNDYFSIEKNTINSRIDRMNTRRDFLYNISGEK